MYCRAFRVHWSNSKSRCLYSKWFGSLGFWGWGLGEGYLEAGDLVSRL